MLCRSGADLSIVDQHGATTVHYAAQSNSETPPDSANGADSTGGLTTLRALLVCGQSTLSARLLGGMRTLRPMLVCGLFTLRVLSLGGLFTMRALFVCGLTTLRALLV